MNEKALRNFTRFPMKLDEVKALLKNENPQKRMSAITALRQYEETVAVPLLASQLKDPEFIIALVCLDWFRVQANVRGVYGIGRCIAVRPRSKRSQ